MLHEERDVAASGSAEGFAPKQEPGFDGEQRDLQEVAESLLALAPSAARGGPRASRPRSNSHFEPLQALSTAAASERRAESKATPSSGVRMYRQEYKRALSNVALSAIKSEAAAARVITPVTGMAHRLQAMGLEGSPAQRARGASTSTPVAALLDAAAVAAAEDPELGPRLESGSATGSASGAATGTEQRLGTLTHHRLSEDDPALSEAQRQLLLFERGHCPRNLLPQYSDVYNRDGRIGVYTLEEREQLLQRFQEKRRRRVWRKKIRYECRKNLANRRLRIKGRFVRADSAEAKAYWASLKAGGGGGEAASGGMDEEDEEAEGAVGAGGRSRARTQSIASATAAVGGSAGRRSGSRSSRRRSQSFSMDGLGDVEVRGDMVYEHPIPLSRRRTRRRPGSRGTPAGGEAAGGKSGKALGQRGMEEEEEEAEAPEVGGREGSCSSDPHSHSHHRHRRRQRTRAMPSPEEERGAADALSALAMAATSDASARRGGRPAAINLDRAGLFAPASAVPLPATAPAQPAPASAASLTHPYATATPASSTLATPDQVSATASGVGAATLAAGAASLMSASASEQARGMEPAAAGGMDVEDETDVVVVAVAQHEPWAGGAPAPAAWGGAGPHAVPESAAESDSRSRKSVHFSPDTASGVHCVEPGAKVSPTPPSRSPASEDATGKMGSPPPGTQHAAAMAVAAATGSGGAAAVMGSAYRRGRSQSVAW